MITVPGEDQKKEAFRLSEDGRFQESLDICTTLLQGDSDPAIEVLTATNLYYAGKLEDAEVFFRDLARKMPDSSYVHSYLAKVLEARKDEGAIAEFAAAVHLDPTNQDALRSYAGYLISQKDHRGALTALRSLVQLGRKPGDLRNLMRALIEIGEPEEALTTHSVFGGDPEVTPEYIDALIGTRRYQAAAEVALRSYRAAKSGPLLRKYLEALSHYDVPASLDAYLTCIREDPDPAILYDYILLLKSTKEYGAALAAVKTLLGRVRDPIFQSARVRDPRGDGGRADRPWPHMKTSSGKNSLRKTIWTLLRSSSARTGPISWNTPLPMRRSAGFFLLFPRT